MEAEQKYSDEGGFSNGKTTSSTDSSVRGSHVGSGSLIESKREASSENISLPGGSKLSSSNFFAAFDFSTGRKERANKRSGTTPTSSSTNLLAGMKHTILVVLMNASDILTSYSLTLRSLFHSVWSRHKNRFYESPPESSFQSHELEYQFTIDIVG